MRILVAEDEKTIADYIKKGLEEMGHSTEMCRNGDSPYELALTQPFDALVLDIMLPGRDDVQNQCIER